MALDFSQIVKWTISVNGVDKEVSSVSVNGVELWKSSEPFITLKSDTQFTMYHKEGQSSWYIMNGTFEYSIDKVNWINWNVTAGTSQSSTITSSSDGYVYLRQRGGTQLDRNLVFSGTTNLKAIGDLRMLLNCENPDSVNSLADDSPALCYLFKSSPITDISKLKLPCTYIGYSACREMFRDCTKLINGSMDMTKCTTIVGCTKMFYNCYNMTIGPRMTTVSVGNYGFQSTFEYCEKLEYAPEGLIIANFVGGTYHCSYMFRYCYKMKTAPPITATTLVGTSTFLRMYYNCYALIQINKLFITELTSSCYEDMYYNCSSIKLYSSSGSGHTKTYRVPWSGTASGGDRYSLSGIFTGTTGDTTSISRNTTYYVSDDNDIV